MMSEEGPIEAAMYTILKDLHTTDHIQQIIYNKQKQTKQNVQGEQNKRTQGRHRLLLGKL